MFGAGEGNRTLVISLEGYMFPNDIRGLAAKRALCIADASMGYV
jgi:hypothetical protein